MSLKTTVGIILAIVAVAAIALLFPKQPRAALPEAPPMASTPMPAPIPSRAEPPAAEEPIAEPAEPPDRLPEEMEREERRRRALERVGGGQEYPKYIKRFDFGLYQEGENPFGGPEDGQAFLDVYNGYVGGTMQMVYREMLAAISDMPGYETMTEEEKQELFRWTRDAQEHIHLIAVDVYQKRMGALQELYEAGEYTQGRQLAPVPRPGTALIIITSGDDRFQFCPPQTVYPSWRTFEDIIAGELDHLWEETRATFRQLISERRE